MSDKALASTTGDMLVHIPMTLTKRQGRKQIVLPAGSETASVPRDITADPLAGIAGYRHLSLGAGAGESGEAGYRLRCPHHPADVTGAGDHRGGDGRPVPTGTDIEAAVT